MSNLSDLIDAIEKSHSDAVNLTGDILGTLADASGALGFVQLTVDFIEGLTSQDLSLQNLLSAIQAGFSQLQGQISASDKLQRMRDVDQGINLAVGVFEQLPAILAASPPPSEDFKLTQIQTCVDAALFFADYDDKWQAVQADLPYYSDPWTGRMAPQAQGDGLVFNYTYTLPQALRSIYILLAAIGALAPKSLPYYADVLTRCLNRLESVHQTIVTSGIVGMRQPNIYEVGTFDTTDAMSFTSNWLIETDVLHPVYYPYGAVEIYSGANNLRSYAGDYFPYWEVDLTTWWSVNANNFLTLLNFRVVRQMKALYVQIGMPAVWNVMNQLRKIVGQPQSADIIYSAWPFSLVESLLGLSLPPPSRKFPVYFPTPWTEPPGLENALRTFLLYTPPYEAYPNMPTPPVALPAGSLYTFLTGVSLQPVLEAVAEA
jgi:hypothetical protein